MSVDFSQLQNALEKATFDAQYWDVACEAVTELFNGTGALLPPSNPQFRGVWMSGTPQMKVALLEYLAEGWHLKDPREGVLKTMFEKGYATDDEVYPDREARAKIPIYRDFLLKYNFGNVCTIRILTPNGYWPMTVHLSNDHPPLNDRDIEIIKTIQPMFEEAAKRASEIAHQRIYDLAQFFKGSNSDVFVFDPDGNQCFNIDKGGKIRTNKSIKALLPNELSESLHSELKEVMVSDPTMSISKAYQFKEGDQTINVLVIQIPPSLRHFFMPFKTCAIRTQCSDTTAVRQQRLRETYGLSDAEISTVDLLASGKNPAAIAELLSLKTSSIRQRLKLIYEKTNSGGQIELVALYREL